MHDATNRNERSWVKRMIMRTFSVDSHKHGGYLQYTIGSVTHFIHSFSHSFAASVAHCPTDSPIWSVNKFDRRRITTWSDGERSYQRGPSITRRAALRNLAARGLLRLIISICSRAFCELIPAPSDDVTRGVPEVIPVTSLRVTLEVIPVTETLQPVVAL